MKLTIYVPRPGSAAAAALAPRSAVVSDPERDASGMALCYYEGAVHGQASLEDFHSKLVCAAGRLVARYPTVAMSGFPKGNLVPVGSYDGERHVVLEVTDADALRAWCGEEPEQVAGRRLPAGRADWRTAAAVAQPPHARPVGSSSPAGGEVWYRSQAGQVLRFDLGRQEAEVFEHDDPALPGLLAHLDLDGDEARRVFGAAAAPRGPGM